MLGSNIKEIIKINKKYDKNYKKFLFYNWFKVSVLFLLTGIGIFVIIFTNNVIRINKNLRHIYYNVEDMEHTVNNMEYVIGDIEDIVSDIEGKIGW